MSVHKQTKWQKFSLDIFFLLSFNEKGIHSSTTLIFALIYASIWRMFLLNIFFFLSFQIH